MKPPILHVVSLPHTRVNEDYNICAYTAKIYKFQKMFPDAVLYSNEGSVKCKHFEQIFSNDDLQRHFGNEAWYQQKQWYKVSYDYSQPHWTEFNNRVIQKLKKRLAPHDIILLIAGVAQKQIADAFPKHISCEFGVGYEGVFSPYRVYESYAWMHYLYGKYGINDGRFFDAVIPNYFDVNDFTAKQILDPEYLLFMGRPIPRKGIEIIKEIAKYHRVITAGAEELPGIEYVGYADTKKRAELMSNAKAILVPTIYIAPFEGVNAEAQLCGTPVITTDFGAFAETVQDGVTGFRCHTLSEFLSAVDQVNDLDRSFIRKRAQRLYSLEVVKPQYERYFDQLSTLWEKGWYQ